MQNLLKKSYQYILKNKYKFLIATFIIYTLALFININIRLKAVENLENLEKQEQKILGAHTQNLKIMLANYTILPDSKKEVYRKEIIKAEKDRRIILLSLLAKNPDTTVKYLISDLLTSEMPGELTKNIEKKITLSGKITISEKDPLNNNSTKKGLIELSDNTKLAVYFTGIQPRPKNGTVIKIEGIKIDNNIITSGYQVSPINSTDSEKKPNNISKDPTTNKSKTNMIKIAITRPQNNSTIGDEDAVLVDASAHSYTRIAKIKIYIDNTLVKTCSVTNFCSHWWKTQSLPKGTHVITIEAQDLSSPQQSKTERVVVTKK